MWGGNLNQKKERWQKTVIPVVASGSQKKYVNNLSSLLLSMEYYAAIKTDK
jgi:hypothetical protein